MTMTHFDPSNPNSSDNGFFGMPATPEESALWLFKVPWDVTTSYQAGTHRGPRHIQDCSTQLDLCDSLFGPDLWRAGICTLNEQTELADWNAKHRRHAEQIIAFKNTGERNLTSDLEDKLIEVNLASHRVNALVEHETRKAHQSGKIFGLIGGDHSSPFGAIKALLEAETEPFGILHIDAHYDLRECYLGFEHSHASIFWNVLNLNSPKLLSLVQVGIRDYSEEERKLALSLPQCHSFLDQDIQFDLLSGRSFQNICEEIVGKLPKRVYLSVDIDGLDPVLCPSTGTPVPGGLSYNQFRMILKTLRLQNKQIIGFDLCEVAPNPNQPLDEWNGNVGARVLWSLCQAALDSRNG